MRLTDRQLLAAAACLPCQQQGAGHHRWVHKHGGAGAAAVAKCTSCLDTEPLMRLAPAQPVERSRHPRLAKRGQSSPARPFDVDEIIRHVVLSINVHQPLRILKRAVVA